MEKQDDMILRDYLALDRTKLANQRTLLAFIRTSLYLAVSGTAVLEVAGLFHIRPLGLILIGSSFVVFLIGIWNYMYFRRKIVRSAQSK